MRFAHKPARRSAINRPVHCLPEVIDVGNTPDAPMFDRIFTLIASPREPASIARKETLT